MIIIFIPALLRAHNLVIFKSQLTELTRLKAATVSGYCSGELPSFYSNYEFTKVADSYILHL